MATRRRQAPPRREGGGELGARIIVAIPALAFAGVIVGFGHWVFAAGLFVLGAICLHELFQMFSFTNPSRLAGD
jgi:phosphatidate cytidylyltransferase